MNNLIKITSGIYRGRTILSPNSILTHPMGSREKIALFNMIAWRLPGSKVLDIFAGSGALGIEALSRGAKSVVFVEKSNKVARIIKENLEVLGIRDSARVSTEDVANFTTDEKFDVIIADPPYDHFNSAIVAKFSNFLAPDGILVLSHPTTPPEIPGMALRKTHQYAKARISLYVLTA